MPKTRLTQKFVDTLKPKTKKFMVHDTLLIGLTLVVYPSGRLGYAVNARVNGKYKRITVGKHPTLTVVQAREKARPLLQQMYEGTDPAEEKAKRVAHEAAITISLQSVYDNFFSIRSLKPKTVSDMKRNAASYLTDWLENPIRNISRKMVEDRFIKLSDNSGPATATKTFRYLSSVLNFAMADEVGGERLIKENPCDVIKDRKLRRTIKPRERCLDELEIEKLFHYIDTERKWPPHKPDGVSDQGINLIVLLLFTGLRLSEALGLKWEDVDFKEQVFVVRDTKNGTDHFVPINRFISALLERQKASSKHSEWVFPARYGTGHMTEPKSQLRAFKKATGVQFTFHDLRRTFATHAKLNGADQGMIGKALNHKSGGSITESYIKTRVDMIRPVFQAVSDQIEYYVKGGTGKAEYFSDGRVFDQMPE